MTVEFLKALMESTSNKSDADLPYWEVVTRIETLNEGLRGFWSQSHGWAPDTAADLMSKSRLDRQVSLSRSLRHWAVEPCMEDGDLILGWANLGSLVEGTVKLLLAVYYEDYKNDLANLKQTQAWHAKKEMVLDPDGLRLEVLIQYCEKAQLFDAAEIAFLKHVQSRRNVIHAFKDNEIGTGAELHVSIRSYLGMLRSVASRLPYPDEMYEPQEY